MGINHDKALWKDLSSSTNKAELNMSGPCSPQTGHALIATASDPVASAKDSDGKPQEVAIRNSRTVPSGNLT
jgi:hypothetical protein